jgi:hypothetical protein
MATLDELSPQYTIVPQFIHTILSRGNRISRNQERDGDVDRGGLQAIFAITAILNFSQTSLTNIHHT